MRYSSVVRSRRPRPTSGWPRPTSDLPGKPVSIVTAGTDRFTRPLYQRRLLRPSPTVLDRALPERACTDWVPARNIRAPDTDCLSRVVEPSTNDKLVPCLLTTRGCRCFGPPLVNRCRVALLSCAPLRSSLRRACLGSVRKTKKWT